MCVFPALVGEVRILGRPSGEYMGKLPRVLLTFYSSKSNLLIINTLLLYIISLLDSAVVGRSKIG